MSSLRGWDPFIFARFFCCTSTSYINFGGWDYVFSCKLTLALSLGHYCFPIQKSCLYMPQVFEQSLFLCAHGRVCLACVCCSLVFWGASLSRKNHLFVQLRWARQETRGGKKRYGKGRHVSINIWIAIFHLYLVMCDSGVALDYRDVNRWIVQSRV